MFLQCYPQELLLILDIPNSNLIFAPDCENLSKARREANTGHRVCHRRHKARHLVQALITFHRVKRASCRQGIYLRLRVGQTDDRTTLKVDFFLKNHCFLIYFAEHARGRGADYAFKGEIDLMNSTTENFMDWSRSFVTRSVNEDLEDVPSSCPAVEVGVGWINGQAVDESFVLGQLAIHAR